MNGLKLSEVEIGEVYVCILSGRKMLVYESILTHPPKDEKSKPTTEKVKAGKFVVQTDDGNMGFQQVQLLDGQLLKATVTLKK